MISIEELASSKYRVKIVKNFINFYSKKDSYLIINNKLKKIIEKDNVFKLNFLKKLLIKRKEKFLIVKIKKDKLSDNEILKFINSIKYGDLFELKNILDINKVFLIVIKNDIFEDDSYKDIFNGFKKYKIFVDEINYIKPYSNIILEIIDENIFKYKTFLIFYEDSMKDNIYKYKILKDCGEIKKFNINSDYFVFKRKRSKIIAFNKKRYYKITKEIIKEKIWKLLEFY